MIFASFKYFKCNIKTCQNFIVQKLEQVAYLKRLDFSDQFSYITCFYLNYQITDIKFEFKTDLKN